MPRTVGLFNWALLIRQKFGKRIQYKSIKFTKMWTFAGLSLAKKLSKFSILSS